MRRVRFFTVAVIALAVAACFPDTASAAGRRASCSTCTTCTTRSTVSASGPFRRLGYIRDNHPILVGRPVRALAFAAASATVEAGPVRAGVFGGRLLPMNCGPNGCQRK